MLFCAIRYSYWGWVICYCLVWKHVNLWYMGCTGRLHYSYDFIVYVGIRMSYNFIYFMWHYILPLPSESVPVSGFHLIIPTVLLVCKSWWWWNGVLLRWRLILLLLWYLVVLMWRGCVGLFLVHIWRWHILVVIVCSTPLVPSTYSAAVVMVVYSTTSLFFRVPLTR